MDEEVMSALEDIGLSKSEVKVYLALLNLGESPISEIVKRTKMYKSNVYDALEKLIEKGLASFVKKEYKKFYTAVDPKKLFEILDEKKVGLESVFELLEKKYITKKQEREVNVLAGKEGIKTILNDILKVNEPIYLFGGGMQITEYLKYHYPQFLEKMKKQKISAECVMIDKPEIRKKVKEAEPLCARFIPEDYFSPVVWAIYGDTLVFILWHKDLLALQIKSREFAGSFRNYFSLMWKVAKE